ncbi:MAG TPA: aminotransferase class IV [Anaerolineales bacterium]|nr:aminotransferase class IV [Anaerolineales bacterium]
MTDPIYYVNGQFVPAPQARIPATDLGLLRGFGVFESLRTYEGRIFRLDDHLSRLEHSASLIGLDLPCGRDELAAAIRQTLDRNEFPETTLRALVTGGSASDGISMEGDRPSLLVMASLLKPYPDGCYENGVRAATSEVERFLPEAKTLFYLPGLLALRAALRADPQVNEVLLVNRRGLVTEGVISNLFLVRGGVLVTPGREVLPGITRKSILELAAGAMEVEARDVHRSELGEADEIFLTGTVRGVMPVSALDGRAVGDGRCGPVTRRLQEAFTRLTRGSNL